MKSVPALSDQDTFSGMLDELIRQLDALQTERARLDKEIADRLEAVRALNVLVKDKKASDLLETVTEKTWKAPKSFNFEGDSVSNAVRKLAREMMKDLNRPVTRAELVKAVQDAGLPLGGENPDKTMSKILTRGKVPQFRSVGHGKGYWPTNLPLPEK